VTGSFDFDVAALATGARRLLQYFNLRLPAASKLAATPPAPAGRDQDGPWPSAPKPTQEGSPLLRIAKIVEAQFKGPSRPETQSYLSLHFARCCAGDNSADAIFAKQTFQATLRPRPEWGLLPW
jgi:hypothetical protein